MGSSDPGEFSSGLTLKEICKLLQSHGLRRKRTRELKHVIHSGNLNCMQCGVNDSDSINEGKELVVSTRKAHCNAAGERFKSALMIFWMEMDLMELPCMI